jgi:drug/metabolite transporter (DMT)-like permease
MTENWLVLAVIAGVASNIFNILNRVILRKEHSDPTAFAWITEITRLFMGLAFVPLNFMLLITTKSLVLFILLSLVEVASTFVFMKMHAYSNLSVSTIIQRTRLIWIPIIAFFLLGERLEVKDYIGIAILFAGLSVTTSPKKITLDSGIKYAYLSTVIVAFLSILMKQTSEFASNAVLMIVMSLASVAFLPFLMKSGVKRIKKELSHDLHLKILPGAANSIAMFFYFLALQLGPVSTVTAIYQGMMVVSVATGILFLGERENIRQKIIGTFITVGGIMILTVV